MHMSITGQVFFQFLFGLIWGSIAAYIANKKGRDVTGWFIGSFFLGFVGVFLSEGLFGRVILGLVGILILVCQSNLNAERAYRKDVEQALAKLRKKQMRGEAFWKHAMSRVGAHDGALDMDTRSLDPVPDTLVMEKKPPEESLATLAAKRREDVVPWQVTGEQQAPVDGGLPAQDASAIDPE